MNYAALNIVNPSDTACRLIGTITVTPLNAAGAAITVAAGWHDHVHLPDLVLGAREHLPTVGSDAAGGPWAQLLLAGNARDDSDTRNALCPTEQIEAPYGWRLTGTIAATIANVDPHALTPPRQLSACTEPGGLHLTGVG